MEGRFVGVPVVREFHNIKSNGKSDEFKKTITMVKTHSLDWFRPLASFAGVF